MLPLRKSSWAQMVNERRKQQDLLCPHVKEEASNEVTPLVVGFFDFYSGTTLNSFHASNFDRVVKSVVK